MKTGRFAEKTFESNIAKPWQAWDLMGFFLSFTYKEEKRMVRLGCGNRGWGGEGAEWRL